MTNYELIVSQGPKYLAHIIAESKLRTMERVFNKFGFPFEVSEKLRAELLMEHHEFLLKEVKTDNASGE